ncbi:MAG TPA: DUF1343 domain-containing protein [Candidatus Hydrogenedens sp.]|nr:DUF1343 domain-containing protein [Candidatus Hydrogenedens sp.]HOL20460.1 DUF1343 domain-containing protein [Candidatus Hydrogenedens sp.]HPP57675.1 DUF1343 domain-containing protein [Candidatus Hydrogenedens sp.]
MLEKKYKIIFNKVLDTAIKNIPTGAVAYIGQYDEVLFFQASGKCSVVPYEEPMDKDVIFDLASLTKVIATTTSILLLYQQGKLKLDEKLYKYIPLPLFKEITIRHLLTHSSGIIGYETWYKEIFSFEDLLIKLSKTKLFFKPGTNHLYSDFGFILLGNIIETISGKKLDLFCKDNIFSPLNMNNTFFHVPKEFIDKCAPTEECPWRKKIIRGEVHDEHAYALGGVAGHAGLFSTAEDLARFSRALIKQQLLEKEVIEEMATCKIIPDYPWQVLGWKTDPFWDSIEGQLPFRFALGHTGFTGTCLWWDRISGYYAILLSNSCHPRREKRDNRKLRKTFYNSLAVIVHPQKMNTHYGIDTLLRNDFQPIKNASVGLYTNTSATSTTGKTTLDIFYTSEKIKLKCIFTAEHGLNVSEESGKSEKQKQWMNIPLIDMYSKHKTNQWREILKTLDWIVIDIQDIGVRYYTYIYSMIQLLKLCMEYNKKVLILDRPNPLGGEIIEGIFPEPSFVDEVCWGNVPVRHGLTIAETALWIQNTNKEFNNLNLDVIKLDGWFYDLFFHELDLQWIPPSPNIQSVDSALCYIGTCLFEGTNISEGRGTKKPFKIIGAPWCNPERIISKIPDNLKQGIEIKKCSFVPKPILGKTTNPKYNGELCEGLEFQIINPHLCRPFRLVVEIIKLIKSNHPNEFQFNAHFDKLCGTSKLRIAIEKNEDLNNLWLQTEKNIQTYITTHPRLYTSLKDETQKLIELA